MTKTPWHNFGLSADCILAGFSSGLRSLGHADKNITLNTYSHAIKSREKLAANKLDDFYSRMNVNSAAKSV